MITMKQMIADLDDQTQEEIRNCVKALYHTGFWRKFIEAHQKAILDNWDIDKEQLRKDIEHSGVAIKTYHQLELLGKEFAEEDKLKHS